MSYKLPQLIISQQKCRQIGAGGVLSTAAQRTLLKVFCSNFPELFVIGTISRISTAIETAMFQLFMQTDLNTP
jgi:hypothetical protein